MIELTTDNNFTDTIKLWLNCKYNCIQMYNNISNWNTLNITNINNRFLNCTINNNLSIWNISNIEDIVNTVHNNYEISKWNISNVTNVETMVNNLCGTLFNRSIDHLFDINRSNIVNDMSNNLLTILNSYNLYVTLLISCLIGLLISYLITRIFNKLEY